MSRGTATLQKLESLLDQSEAVERLCAGVDDSRPAPATVFFVAHADDEVLGAGGRLPRLRSAIFVHVTDGSPRDEYDARRYGFESRQAYAVARRNEMHAALALAGISPGQTRELGVTDQEAALHMDELPRRIAAMIDELDPEVVMTHPYEGGHPDHDATAFAVHAAVALIQRDGGRVPVLVEMTSYHNSSTGIETGMFLPEPGHCGETVVKLSPAEQEFKKTMMASFATQQETLQYFRCDVERFRPAPRYDFTIPPHAGTLFYDMFPWGMTGERFRQLAREAMSTLGLSGPV